MQWLGIWGVAGKQSESGQRIGTKMNVGVEMSREIGMPQVPVENTTYRGAAPASRYRSSICPTIRLPHGPLRILMA